MTHSRADSTSGESVIGGLGESLELGDMERIAAVVTCTRSRTISHQFSRALVAVVALDGEEITDYG
jgi:hypothetical protein